MRHLTWMCLDPWKLDHPTFSYKWTLRVCLEILAGDCSYSNTLDPRMSSSSGKAIHFQQAHSFGRDVHGAGALGEEGDTYPASQIGQVNSGDQCSGQRSDSCHNRLPSHPRLHCFWEWLDTNHNKRMYACPKGFTYIYSFSSHIKSVLKMKLKHKRVKQPAGEHTDDQGQSPDFSLSPPVPILCGIIMLDLLLLGNYVPTN